jgi:hypothetical protein
MHASLAFVNGAGQGRSRRRQTSATDADSLSVLHALLSTMASESHRPSLDKTKSQDERQAEEENQEETASKPGGFRNDPEDPKNPNEVRERHLKKIKP